MLLLLKNKINFIVNGVNNFIFWEKKIRLKDLRSEASILKIEVYYNVPISLEGNSNYEIALIGCNIWFSWYNISHEYKNNF
jgi:hypothetical protein